MNNLLKPNSWQDYVAALFLFAVFFSGLFIFWKAIVVPKQPDNGSNTPPTISPRPVVSCEPDFLSYQELSKDSNRVAKLIDKQKAMYATGGTFINSEVVITKTETEVSKVACGYLFVRAGTKKYGALQNWENIYINPNGFGGHMYSKEHIGLGDGANFSEYLFPLNKIQYWKNRAERAKDNLSNADWSALLNVSPQVEFIIALNTEDKTGFIDEISIAYKCWNPQTGEENDQCHLNVEKKPDTIKPLP